MTKTYNEINQKIEDKSATILTAEEMINLVEKEGLEYAAEAVDVVTTGTFGCMCSSGVFFNLKQPDPPIRIDRVWLDGVKAYHGTAAVDMYLGVTKKVHPHFLQQHPEIAKKYPVSSYGGGHVLEKLIHGQSVLLQAISSGTVGYPRKNFEKEITLKDFNQAILLNPRNAYQRYSCAVNTSDRTIYTYMGKLLPKLQNGTYGGVGTLSPLNNDPSYRTIGLGTKIFLGGASGFVIGEGTQHNPKGQFGTLMVKGDLKKMSSEFISGAYLTGYGLSAYIGLGIPIPILDENLAKSCALPDSEIFTDVVDYSTGERSRPVLKSVSYQTLKENALKVNDKHIPLSSTSSIPKSRLISKNLKSWLQTKKFTLNPPVEPLSRDTDFESLEERIC